MQTRWCLVAIAALVLGGCGAADPSDEVAPLEAERPPTTGAPVVATPDDAGAMALPPRPSRELGRAVTK